MILSAIVAMARNRVIGKNNKLPWDIPEDMQYFIDKTRGKIMIMGRKTFESLDKPLPKRFHIVITRKPDYKVDHPNVTVVSNVDQAITLAKSLIGKYPDEVMVIGGGEIYKEMLPVLNRIYLTVIDKDYEGDAKFPEFDLKKFKLTSDNPRDGFSFKIFEAVKF
jgi:dihydrofolate reductase